MSSCSKCNKPKAGLYRGVCASCHAKDARDHKSKHDLVMKMALGYIEKLHKAESENISMRVLLNQVIELYPYLNCVCGRNKPRLSDSIRTSIITALK